MHRKDKRKRRREKRRGIHSERQKNAKFSTGTEIERSLAY